jgi:hypothetical protein
MARAGFCTACNANQWLNEDGSCLNGHPASCVSGVYEAEQARPVPAPPIPAPLKKRMPTWAVVLIVVAILTALPICGGTLIAIGVPVFLNASSNAQQKSCFANERTVTGAAQVYLAENPGATLPSDWSGLMSVLIPSILKAEPKCPSGGTYTITTSGTSLKVSCSTHGSFEDAATTP